MSINKCLGDFPLGKQRLYLILIISFFVLADSGFSYINWNPTMAGQIMKLVLFGLLAHFFLSRGDRKMARHRIFVILMCLLPFLSVINSHGYFGQPISSGIWVTTANIIWLFYFVLHSWKVKESTILWALLLISLFIVAVQVAQQFTYPNAYFGITRFEDLENPIAEQAEMRNGLWRFRMGYNAYYAAPVLFACWIWLRKKFDVGTALIAGLLIVSVYLLLTRQVIFSFILTLFLSFFLGRRKVSVKYLVTGLILIGVIYCFYDVLFGEFAAKTKEESNDDNIRLFAGTYFWEKSTDSIQAFLFGYGDAAQTGSFRVYSDMLTRQYRFFTVDVGFIGALFHYGAVYVITSFTLLYALFFKDKARTPLYIRLFVVFTAVMSIMIYPFASNSSFLVWALLLYVADLHLGRSPLRLTTSSNINLKGK